MTELYGEFVAICGKLTEKFNITPLLFGSLGLQRRLNLDLHPDDIDVLLPEKIMTERWQELLELAEQSGWALIDLREHCFEKNGARIAFAANDLKEYAGINTSETDTISDSGAEYQLLTLPQYLSVYEKSLTDDYRQGKKQGKDREKISLIRKALSKLPLAKIYNLLYSRYGELNWWPAKTPYEVMVGAVLTQNTAWSNVERAIANFDGDVTPERVQNADITELADLIRPSGFFNQKAAYLKAVTEWYGRYSFSVPTIQREPLEKLRKELLVVKGIGQETADSILLYAFGFPTFVVDAYTKRLCSRLPFDAGNSYSELKAYFETKLPRDSEFYNNYHALIVINAKEHCRKVPKCGGCPLNEICERYGI
ncbi:MAG: endonuclease III domain-containing protein [Oscillospiraceae bacterium]|jgi:endonuclease-3 related protein|nr:endonuclease III domain-containing protein [Oscillospiraceae bacterium]